MKHEKSKNDAMRHELDHIDAKILNLLRENATYFYPPRQFPPELSGWRRKATLQDIRSN